jgi:hypothetical protein
MDLDNLDHLVSDYFRYWSLMRSADRKDRLEAQEGDRLDNWLRESLVSLGRPAPEACWPVLVALIERAPDDLALSIIAAGPLADLLTRHGEQFAERLETHTRRARRFRDVMQLIHHWEGVPGPLRERLEALTRTNN